MNEKARQFIEKAQNDEDVKAKLKDIAEQFKGAPQNEETQIKAISAIIPIAKEKGFDIKPEDFQIQEGEVQDGELENIAGGGGCMCAAAGGGGGTDAYDGNTYGCACVFYGQGGDGSASDFNCYCVAAGAGADHLD